LILLTDEEISELSSEIAMKFGHRKRFPVEIRKAQEEEKRKEQDMQLEERRKEQDRQLEEDLAKLQRDKVLREALKDACSPDDQEKQPDTKLHETEKDAKENIQQDTTTGGKGAHNHQLQALPPGKRFHFFASHSE
jgi:hypothetical protein